MLIVVAQLFSDFCPKTSKNFEALCTGEQGLTKSGVPLCYKDSLFHRVVSNGWVQGGGRHLSKAVQKTNNPSQANYSSQFTCPPNACLWTVGGSMCTCKFHTEIPSPPGDSILKPFCWEATARIMPLTCSVAILVHLHMLKGLRCSDRFQHDRMCFSDISPERKGNGGESIYGPTFEGKSHMYIFI